MNRRTLFPSLLFTLLVSSILTAQQTPDSTDNRLATILHLSVLSSQDWQALFSEAESGNAEAQYWLGRIYSQGISALVSRQKQKWDYAVGCGTSTLLKEATVPVVT